MRNESRIPLLIIIWTNTVYELLCNLIGSSTSRLSFHILLVVKKQNKMAERFAKANEHEIRVLLDDTTPKIPCLSI